MGAATILALDPATKFGWAYGSTDCPRPLSGTWDLSVRRDESGGMRIVRLQTKLREVLVLQPDLVVFEGARHAGPGMQGALVVQSELQGVIKLVLELGRHTYRAYSPSEIKKHATGKGNSAKAAMLEAARRAFPDIAIADDNQADALLLWRLAASEYGKGADRAV